MNAVNASEKHKEKGMTWSFCGAVECPCCQSLSFQRIRRLSWMRLFPKAQLIQCKECGCKRFLALGL